MDISQKLDGLRKELEKYESLTQALLDKCEGEVYLVGGALRDALLQRDILDLDFALRGNAGQLGKIVAAELKGTYVSLDAQRDEGRLVLKGEFEVDLSGLGQDSVEEDLARRDFTINTMAIPLRDLLNAEYRLLDPLRGVEDISSGLIRAVSEDSFAADPIRILRALRFSGQLGFALEERTLGWMRRDAHLLANCPGERVWNELKLTFGCPESSTQVEVAASIGVLETLFPELTDTRSIGQAKGFIQNLFDHCLLTYRETEQLVEEPEETPFAQAGQDLREYLPRRVPLLKLAALLHDIGKPQCEAVNSSGATHFYGHERIGVEEAKKIARERLRLSNRETKTLTTLIAHHMRPHLLAREERLSQRAMRKFFRDSEDEGLGVLLLAYADALASRQGERGGLERATSQLLSFHIEEKRRPRLKRLITGHDLIAELNLEPSPLFRVILKEIEERQLEGEIGTKEEALILARQLAKERSA